MFDRRHHDRRQTSLSDLLRREAELRREMGTTKGGPDEWHRIMVELQEVQANILRWSDRASRRLFGDRRAS